MAKNFMLAAAISAYRMRDVEGFERVLADFNLAGEPKSVQKQIRNMNAGIRNPLPEPKKLDGLDPNDSTFKAMSRAMRRRIFSNRNVPNGAILRDNHGSEEFIERDGKREFNGMIHATKGARFRSRVLTSKEQVNRDSGYTAMILPDTSDKEATYLVNAPYRLGSRHAIVAENYLKRNGNTPGSVRRAAI